MPANDGSLLTTLLSVVQKILNVTADEAMDVCSQRLRKRDMAANYSDCLLECDAALDCMEHRDITEFVQEKKSLHEDAAEHATFVASFKDKRVALLEEAAGKKKAKLVKAKGPVVKPKIPNAIEQKEAKKYVPPGASIWRNRIYGAWCGHCPPRSRISEPWLSAEQLALRRLLERLWAQHVEFKGLPWDAVPWSFEDAAAAAAASSTD